MLNTKPYTTGQVSKICRVDKKTVSKWIKEGRLEAYQLPSGDNRIEPGKLLRFLKKYNFPVPSSLEKVRSKNLLIVDDDKKMVASLKRLFYSDNYNIETAYDGFEAGVKLYSFKPNCIILDLKMPGIDGVTIAEKIRTNFSNDDIKIIILSAYLNENLIGQLNHLKVDAIMEKPFNELEIKEKVSNFIN